MANNTIEQFDAIVIGSGQGGKPLAIDLAKAGKKTAVIERQLVGGTCINYGCTPTKTMVASARVAYLANRSADYGVKTGHVEIDMHRVRERKRHMVESFRSGIEHAYEETENLDWISGHAKFTAPKEIEIALQDGSTRRLTAGHIFINTGTRNRLPQIEGFDTVPTFDSTSIMELDHVPDHLLIMGGGYIGVEFGQMFRRFGSKVTIIQRTSQLLQKEDLDVAREVAEILRDEGIEVEVETQVIHLAEGEVTHTVRTKAPQGLREYTCKDILVAIGRIPNTDDLALDKAGIATDERGYVKVNGRLETNVEGVYALGDVKGGPAFTHISYDDYRVLKANVLGGKAESISKRVIPYTVFMDPQLGRIGMTEKEAREKGLKIKIANMPMKNVARALETDETRGLIKVVIDAGTDRILGAAVVAMEGGEIMTMLQIAMMGDLPYTRLRDAIFSHPGLGEGFNTLFASLKE